MSTAKPVITFGSDWRVEQSGPLVGVSTVILRYARQRLLSEDELGPKGPQNFTITCYVKQGDEVSHLQLGSRSRSGQEFEQHEIPVSPTARRLEIWFARTTLYGSISYDSNFGRNFVFDILPRQELSDAVTTYVHEYVDAIVQGKAAN